MIMLQLRASINDKEGAELFGVLQNTKGSSDQNI